MRKMVFGWSVFMLGSVACFAQYYEEPERSYALSAAITNTSSGHGSELNIIASYEENQKAFELGGLIDVKHAKFGGADFLFKYYLSPRFIVGQRGIQSLQKKRLYFYYNCALYKGFAVNAQSPGTEGNPYPDFLPGKVNTIEHYTGIGYQRHLTRNLFVDGQIGIGTYIGSIYKNGSRPSTIGIHWSEGGLGLSAKLGLVYLL